MIQVRKLAIKISHITDYIKKKDQASSSAGADLPLSTEA